MTEVKWPRIQYQPKRNTGPRGKSWQWSSETPLESLTEEQIKNRTKLQRYERIIAEKAGIPKEKRIRIDFVMHGEVIRWQKKRWYLGREIPGETGFFIADEEIKKYYAKYEALKES